MAQLKWRETAELIGIASIVASLVFVGLEVRQSGRAAIESALADTASMMVETESLVLSHPDVWQRGCLNDELEPEEQVVFSRIHHVYTFSRFFEWLRTTDGVGVGSGQLSIDNIAMNIHRYPGFKAEWEAHGQSRQHVHDEAPFQVFRRLVDQRVQEFPSFEANPLSDVSRCGLN
jgi:hypothetical protein